MAKPILRSVKIRPARLTDCLSMKNLINTHAAHGLMRSKSLSQLQVTLLNYIVAELDGRVIGVCGLKIWPSEGIEIISSAVRSEYHKQGVGIKLNMKIINQARKLGFKKFFVLTKQPGFYGKLGFKEIEKNGLSAKIFTDCANCPENASNDPGRIDCSDIALQRIF